MNQVNREITESESFMTTEEAASFLGLAVITLSMWRVAGKGPKFCKLGGAVRYRRSVLIEFAESCEAESTTGTRSMKAKREGKVA